MKIEINRILEKFNLDKLEIASALFPENNYPSIALTRVIKGEALLNSEQLSKLASLAGVPVDALYNVREWKTGSKTAGQMALENGEFRAVINTDTWGVQVFKKDSLLHETILNCGGITLSDLIGKIEEIININNK